MKRDMNTVIDNYKKGEISLFEASDILNMHPREFLDVLVNKREVKAVCNSF